MEAGRTPGRAVSPVWRERAWTALRVGLGVLFVAASIYKIGMPGAFAHQIYNYKLLPSWAVNPLAIVLPWLQLFCGAALIVNRWVAGASVLVALMMLAFLGALGSALARGLNIACGCFKTGGSPATGWTFLRDLTLTALACLQAWRGGRSWK